MAYHLVYHAGPAGKATRKDAKGLVRHTQRKTKGTKNHSNPDIKPELTKYNIDLLWKGMTADDRIEERLENEYKGKRSLRKDHIVLREIITQPTPEYFEGMTIEEKQQHLKKFIDDAMPWFMKEFGKENVVGASGHLDEENPHAHFMIMPMTKDGRVSQTEFFKGPNDLKRQHKSYREHMIAKGWDFDKENKYAVSIDDVPQLKFKKHGKEIQAKRAEQSAAVQELAENDKEIRQIAVEKAYDDVYHRVLLKERERLREEEEYLESQKNAFKDIQKATEDGFLALTQHSDDPFVQNARKNVQEDGIGRLSPFEIKEVLEQQKASQEARDTKLRVREQSLAVKEKNMSRHDKLAQAVTLAVLKDDERRKKVFDAFQKNGVLSYKPDDVQRILIDSINEANSGIRRRNIGSAYYINQQIAKQQDGPDL